MTTKFFITIGKTDLPISLGCRLDVGETVLLTSEQLMAAQQTGQQIAEGSTAIRQLGGEHTGKVSAVSHRLVFKEDGTNEQHTYFIIN